MPSIVAGQYRSILNGITGELSERIRMLKSPDFDGLEHKTAPMIKEMKAYRKAFFYRRDKYHGADEEHLKEASEIFALLVFEIITYLATFDKKVEELFNES